MEVIKQELRGERKKRASQGGEKKGGGEEWCENSQRVGTGMGLQRM